MAGTKMFSLIFFVVAVHQSTAWLLWSSNAGAQQADGYFRHQGVNGGYGGSEGYDENQQGKDCGVTMSGPWAKGVNLSYVPNPPEYDKEVDAHLEFYVYDDLVFGTIKANVSREHDSWQHQFSGILCDMNVGCPWHKGETKKFSNLVAAPSTYIDKGTYNANVAIYNEDNLILFAEAHCTF